MRARARSGEHQHRAALVTSTRRTRGRQVEVVQDDHAFAVRVELLQDA